MEKKQELVEDLLKVFCLKRKGWSAIELCRNVKLKDLVVSELNGMVDSFQIQKSDLVQYALDRKSWGKERRERWNS